jgi:hypothetical protein
MIKKHQLEPLFQALSIGAYITDACEHADISRDAYYEHIKKDPKFQRRVEKAILASKMSALATVRRAFKTHWQSAGWFLERKWPNEFSLRINHAGTAGKPIGVSHDFGKIDEKTLVTIAAKLDAVLRPPQPRNKT